MYPATLDVLAAQVRTTECCTGATPVPDRETAAGEPLALLTSEMLPPTLPAVVGLNWTTKVSFCVGVSVTGALPPVIE